MKKKIIFSNIMLKHFFRKVNTNNLMFQFIIFVRKQKVLRLELTTCYFLDRNNLKIYHKQYLNTENAEKQYFSLCNNTLIACYLINFMCILNPYFFDIITQFFTLRLLYVRQIAIFKLHFCWLSLKLRASFFKYCMPSCFISLYIFHKKRVSLKCYKSFVR